MNSYLLIFLEFRKECEDSPLVSIDLNLVRIKPRLSLLSLQLRRKTNRLCHQTDTLRDRLDVSTIDCRLRISEVDKEKISRISLLDTGQPKDISLGECSILVHCSEVDKEK